jgi:hypothetical protein
MLGEEVSWRGRSRCGARRWNKAGGGSRKVWRWLRCFRPKEEEAPVARWATWAGLRWLGQASHVG